MTPAQAAYRAGCVFSEVEYRLAGRKGLSPACYGNCARMPDKLPVLLRHLWPKALRDPAIVPLLDGWEPPATGYDSAAQACFGVGYYHQRSARSLPPDFPARLRSLREAAGLSAPQLAEKAGVSRQAVNYYEAGERAPTWDAVQALAAALGVPTDAFRTK